MIIERKRRARDREASLAPPYEGQVNPMPLSAEDVSRAALGEAAGLLDQCVAKIVHCVGQLSDEQVWWRPAESMNSIGNLILHLCGNLRQWMVSGIGGAADIRKRPAEFAERGPIPKAELLANLERVVADTKQALKQTSAEDMARTHVIQGFTVTGWAALFHTVPHFNGHTQEIIAYTRMQLGERYKFHWQPASAAEGRE
jgi:uncharacterized damage-inducible protein DinB